MAEDKHELAAVSKQRPIGNLRRDSSPDFCGPPSARQHLPPSIRRIPSSCLSLDGICRVMPRLKRRSPVHDLGLSGVRSRTLRSRPPLNRFQEIFHAIKTNRYPNRTQLARSIEVTTKTIQRELDYMRYQLGLPIEFDYARGGYYFTKPTTDLPLFQLTEAELVSVFVAQKALEAYRGTPFEQPLRTAFQKLQAATRTLVSKLVLVGRILAQASLSAISTRTSLI